MKVLVLLLLFSSDCFTQTLNESRILTPQNIDNYLRLNVEFEIKNNSTPDSTIIRSIPFNSYNQLRKQTEDIEILDHDSNYTIILYSDEKCKLNKH